MGMIPFYGLHRQHITLRDELLDATDMVLKSGMFVSGQYTKTFEEWLKEKTGCAYAVTIHSGTQALNMIANSIAVSPRDGIEVSRNIRIPNLTYVATLNAYITTDKYNIEIADTDANGIMLQDDRESCYVGLYGSQIPFKCDPHKDIVDGAQHWLVADGNIGLAMAISFDPTKNLPSTGNGGAVVTNDIWLYRYIINYKNNGKTSDNYTYDKTMEDTNSKMSELDCAHLLVRTRYLDRWQLRRRQIRNYYIEKFKDLPIRCLSASTENHSDHKFVIDVGGDRTWLKSKLQEAGVSTMIHYEESLSELAVARYNKKCKTIGFVSTSTMLSRSVLSLPIYPELTDSEVEYITNTVCDLYKKN